MADAVQNSHQLRLRGSSGVPLLSLKTLEQLILNRLLRRDGLLAHERFLCGGVANGQPGVVRPQSIN
jgi:hypothetical protein